jgi:hypothetical protein
VSLSSVPCRLQAISQEALQTQQVLNNRVVKKHNQLRRRKSTSSMPPGSEEAIMDSGVDSGDTSPALEHASSLGSPGHPAPSLHDIFYEERAQWRQDLSSALPVALLLQVG